MSLALFLADLWAFEVVLLKKLILRKMHLKFWNVHSLSSCHLEFLAGNGWKCNILIWNQLFLKKEGPFFTFPSKSPFRHFWLFFSILAYISLSLIDNMVPFYTDAHIEEGPFFTFLSKSHFRHFFLFFYFGLYLPFCDRQCGTFLYGRTHIK